MDLFPCPECGGLDVSMADDLTDPSPVRCTCCSATPSGEKAFRSFCVHIVARDSSGADGRFLALSSVAQHAHPGT
jgi:hypothetical protein